MSMVATCTIKYTEAEVVLLINSLEMTTSAKVPCVDNGAAHQRLRKLRLRRKIHKYFPKVQR